MKKFFVLLVLIFSFLATFQVFSEEADSEKKIEKTVITIEQAQKVENTKDVVNGGDCILLTGNVRISVSRGNSKTTITAEKINYNRATEMLYAEGSVSLEQTGGKAGGEKISASSLLFNTSTLEGVFDNGRAVQTSSDAINLPSGSTLIVASDVFGRDSGGTIAFKSGELTFCDDEDPHWKIRATRIWLLPGGEFAFLNATLFVGHVPLLYLPAFYYPKDELIFNPAFGYRQREGYYINTTTYLYGRKGSDALSSSDINSKLNSDSSDSSSDDDKINFFSFMNTGVMKEQRREGLVLHNLDEDFTGDTSKYFKVMADYYANMGAMVGFDGVFAPNSVLTSLKTNLQLAFSNTVFRNNSVYLAKNAAGNIVGDESNFMGQKLPFRYQANLKFSIAKPFTLNFSMPVYSDPFFDYDFNTRAETMDWIDYAMSNTGPKTTDDEVTVSDISSFSWEIDGSYSFKVPDFLNPYITTLSISSFSSSIAYASKTNDKIESDPRYSEDDSWEKYSPERKFYYPSQITPFKASGRIAGTIFNYPSKKRSSYPSLKESLPLPSDLTIPETEKKKEDEENKVFGEDCLPLLSVPAFSVTQLNGITYSLDYSLSPDFESQVSYSSEKLSSPEDFEWNDMQSTFVKFKNPTTLSSKLGYKDSFFSLSDTFTFEPVYQSHPYMKITETTAEGGYKESSAASVRRSDYSARKMDLTDVNALSFRPLCYTEHFSETSLTWNTTLKMIRTNYVGGSDAEHPEAEWEYLTADLTDDESFTVHNLNLVLGANEFDKKVYQTLSLTTTLPPKVDSYHGDLTLGFPYLVFTAGSGIKQKSKDDETWEKEDFVQSLTLNMFDSKLSFRQSYTYDLESEEHESFNLSLSGFGFRADYRAEYMNGAEFITEDKDNGDGTITKISKGWADSSEKKFQPSQASLSYISPSKNFTYLGNRISFAPELSTSFVYDFRRPTNSFFKFRPAFTFKINEFLNIKFSAESKNSVIYRYFCSQDEYQEKYNSSGERNILKDLFDSFRFDDVEKRKHSAFKIQELRVDVTHELCDWDLNCAFSIKPRLMTQSSKGYSGKDGRSYYDFSPYFSISVAWRPLSSMKTQIVDEYGEWKLNP